MAELLLSTDRSFGAGHVLEGEPECQYPHGHAWHVTATITAFLDPTTGSTKKLRELSEALGLVVAEVEGKSFNDMVPQVKPNLEGVAMWFVDRLSPDFKIVEVEVEWAELPRRCLIRRQPR